MHLSLSFPQDSYLDESFTQDSYQDELNCNVGKEIFGSEPTDKNLLA